MNDHRDAASAAAKRMPAIDRAQRIRTLNDAFRKTLVGGKLLVTRTVLAKWPARIGFVIRLVQQFEAFSADNDPYGEHDLGAFDFDGERLLWKIDYYDQTLQAGSPDPADPSKTTRVLTLMLLADY